MEPRTAWLSWALPCAAAACLPAACQLVNCARAHEHALLRSHPRMCTCSLHGGKDQSDRESTIADFKANVCNILTATSGGLALCN